VDEHEAARPVRGLSLASLKAAVADEGRLLIAGDTGDCDCRSEQLRLGDDFRGRHHPRQHAGIDPEDLEELAVPPQRIKVEKHRARGVGRISDVDAAFGEPPDEP
jgi:hypothetical protein